MATRLDVCICTFRRVSLAQTLASIAAQRLPPGIEIGVVVADNDDSAVRRTEIVATGATLGLDLAYVHAPARNISVARNACLDAASGDWIAFIDDDEVATPDWIATLLNAQPGHDIVFGVSQARYPDPATPGWIIRGDFHSNRIQGNDAPWNGYTANVLINRQFIAANGLRFASELGQTGGEDTLFFFEAHDAGARFAYAPDAVVHEDTAIARANLRWLALRRFRSGQIHHLVLRRSGGSRLAGLTALPKVLACLAQAALLAFWPTRAAAAILRGSLHLGVIASILGFAPYREYAVKRPGSGR